MGMSSTKCSGKSSNISNAPQPKMRANVGKKTGFKKGSLKEAASKIGAMRKK